MASDNVNKNGANNSAWYKLAGAAVASLLCYVLLLASSSHYGHTVEEKERWILPIIGLYAAAFIPYWLAWQWVSAVKPSRQLIGWLLGTSALFRLLLLPTPPFQEIDIYRYLWDGKVTATGHDPYQFPPSDVLAAKQSIETGGSVEPSTLNHLAQQAIDEPAYSKILGTIHYGELPSPYPPVSQAVFAAASLTSPSSTAAGHLTWLKLWLVLFDLATLGLVIAMLRMAGRHPGLAVAYGWCPLVLKEVAGSGHLDSIATFFAIAATSATMMAVTHKRSFVGVGTAALSLGLGVGAKLFPIILAPIFVWFWLRRFGIRIAMTGLAVLAALSFACLMPMFSRTDSSGAGKAGTANEAAGAIAEAEQGGLADGPLPSPPNPFAAVEHSQQADETVDKTAGLAAFLSRWEMNDLLFMVTLENLRQQGKLEAKNRAWFVVTTDSFSAAILQRWRNLLEKLSPDLAQQSDQQISFLLARVITGSAFVLIALWLALRSTRNLSDVTNEQLVARLAQAVFLTLAWFWLLAPTQNPWYWCWAVPLLPFARSRAWAALAALTLLYYLRFWLKYHMADQTVLGTRYQGELFYYFVIVWIEFAPWFVWLGVESWSHRRRVR